MKVLVVDDSIVFRSGITQALGKEPGLQVFKAVSNGKIAVDFLKLHPDIDIITLDMEMPVMNGLDAIKEIRKFNRKVIIIVFSALTVRGAEHTIDALTHGANDFVSKIEGTGNIDESVEMIRNELMPKIRAFASKQGQFLNPEKSTAAESASSAQDAPQTEISSVQTVIDNMTIKPKLICIGSSTGGPDALRVIFEKVTTTPNVPILIVQHMPPIFTAKLASLLNNICQITVKEAEEGEELKPGVCYIAPGDYHMAITKIAGMYKIKLNQREKVCFVRPSVDVLFESVSKHFEGQVMSIVLTGMGRDGTEGAKILNSISHDLFIQDKESATVWGMAGSIDKAQIGARTLKLTDFSTLINHI
jgi:two-component system chemotaxis response regulator CheB